MTGWWRRWRQERGDGFTIRMSTTSKGVKAGNASFTWGGTLFAFGIIGEAGDSFVQNLYHDIFGAECGCRGAGGVERADFKRDGDAGGYYNIVPEFDGVPDAADWGVVSDDFGARGGCQ